MTDDDLTALQCALHFGPCGIESQCNLTEPDLQAFLKKAKDNSKKQLAELQALQRKLKRLAKRKGEDTCG